MTDNRAIFYDALRSAGLTPQQALGALWSIAGESGSGFDTAAYNPNDPGGSAGALQWLGKRRTGLEAYAQRMGKPVTDPYLQARYMAAELTGDRDVPEAQVQTGVLDALRQARTPEDAAHVWTAKMERPLTDNSDERIARYGHSGAVGSVDEAGNFIVGSGKAAPAGTAWATAGTSNSPQFRQLTPMETLGSSLGSELAGMASPGGGGGAGQIIDPPDPPPIHSAALDENFMPPTPSPVPAQFSGLGAQLAPLGIPAQAAPIDASITQGAPSMTALLGQIGGTGANIYDPRRPSLYNPNANYSRIG